MKEAAQRRWANPADRERMRISCKRAVASEEARTMMSELRKKEWADPDVRAKRIAGCFGSHGAPFVKKMNRIPVPSWVPDDLASIYREKAARACEEDAASLVRRLKREAEGASA
jgi:hypothetical protein